MRGFLPINKSYYPRARMDILFDKATENSLVTVVAPPGYGKSLALAGYARKTKKRLVWLFIHKPYNDAGHFWASFLLAVSKELPLLAEQLEKTPFPATSAQFDSFIHMFSQGIYDGEEVLLIVDDYNRISNTAIMEFFEALIQSDPDNLSIVLVSNKKIPFGSVSMPGGHFRISMDELRFNEAETFQMFRQFGISLSDDECKRLLADTDGWPMALHLIGGRDLTSSTQLFNEKSHLQIAAELFEAGYFSTYSEEMQYLLALISYFTAFPSDVLRNAPQGNTNELLDGLSSNIFITYDYSTGLYYVQNMYRDFLTHKQPLLAQEDIISAHVHVGEWYHQHGFLHAAIDCFMAIKDYDRLIDVVRAMPKSRKSALETNGILARLNELPQEYRETHLTADFCRAFMLLNNGQTRRAYDTLNDLVLRLEADLRNPEHVALLGETHIVLADICFILNIGDALGHWQAAAKFLPNGSTIRNRGVYVVENNNVFYLPDNSPGQFDKALQYQFDVAACMEKLTDGGGYGFELLYAAEGTFYRGDMEQASQYCLQAVYKAQKYAQYDIVCNAYWLLTRISLYYGDYQGATNWMRKISSTINENNVTDLFDLQDCAESWFCILMGDPDRAADWVTNNNEIYANLPLDVGRNLTIVAIYLLDKGEHQAAYATLGQFEDIFRDKGLWPEKVTTNIMKAFRLLSLEDSAGAIQTFAVAYDMVYHNNLPVLLIEFGKNIVKLLETAMQQEVIPFDNAWLADVIQRCLAYERRMQSVIRTYKKETQKQKTNTLQLTERETEALQLLAQGYTREEIASTLRISVNGVKKRITNIYNKLGATNRADAIYIATVNGLISDEEAK